MEEKKRCLVEWAMHYRQIIILLTCCLTLCLFSTAIGVMIQGVDFGVTCVMGLVSLMGVIPMILGGSGLWMPMGTVIFYGTLITMFFILTVIPVAYWKALAGSTKRRVQMETMERQ